MSVHGSSYRVISYTQRPIPPSAQCLGPGGVEWSTEPGVTRSPFPDKALGGATDWSGCTGVYSWSILEAWKKEPKKDKILELIF